MSWVLMPELHYRAGLSCMTLGKPFSRGRLGYLHPPSRAVAVVRGVPALSFAEGVCQGVTAGVAVANPGLCLCFSSLCTGGHSTAVGPLLSTVCAPQALHALDGKRVELYETGPGSYLQAVMCSSETGTRPVARGIPPGSCAQPEVTGAGSQHPPNPI